MYELQTCVQVEGKEFPIQNSGDYRVILDCFRALNDPDLSPEEQVYAAMIIFYEDFDSIGDIFVHRDIADQLQFEMMKFFNCGKVELKSNTGNHKLIDWEKDSNMICAAVNAVANCEIRALEYLHWWTFFGYYMSVGESVLSNVVSIRYKIAKGEKLEKYERKFKQENPDYFDIDMRTREQIEAENELQKLWGGE